MLLRMIAVGLIWFGCSIAWLVLGGTVTSRTSEQQSQLWTAVGGLYGSELVQAAPHATHPVEREHLEYVDFPGGQRETRRTTRTERLPVPLASQDVKVSLDLDQRRKGLLWFATYQAAFDGTWRVTAPAEVKGPLTFVLPLAPGAAAYDELVVEVDGRPLTDAFRAGQVEVPLTLKGGETAAVRVAYRAGGLDEWRYQLGQNVEQHRDLRVEIQTDFDAYDFPAGTLSPTRHGFANGKGTIVWESAALVTRLDLGVAAPKNLNPGPFVSRLTFFAPVALLFFFFALFVLVEVREFRLHPMHYLFLAAGAFAFHLLLAYLADHLVLEVAFLIAAGTSVLLVGTYLARAISTRFAVLYGGPAHLVYLVLFSAAFFSPGTTGLTIAVGAVLSLMWAMHVTAHVKWEERFGTRGGAQAKAGAAISGS